MTRNKIIGFILGLSLTILLFLLIRPNPEKIFLRQITHTLRTVNQGRHLAVQDQLSPEALQTIENSGLSAAQLLLMIHRQDTSEGRQYRLDKLSSFTACDYAEVLFQRSDSGGTYRPDAGFFIVPFLYRDKKWWVSGSFRSNTTWQFPE